MPRPDVTQFSDPSFLILASLTTGPKHGYAIMADIQTFSGIVLEPGTLYGALNRLEERGFIRPTTAVERRRPYELTAAGEQLFRDRLKIFSTLADVGKQRLSINGV